MVQGSTLGATYPYYPICNIDGIALRAACSEFYKETGYGDSVGRYGYGHLRRAN